VLPRYSIAVPVAAMETVYEQPQRADGQLQDEVQLC
jgi:hypothetical protein